MNFPFHSQNDIHSWHLFVIQLSENLSLTRNEFIEKMYDAGVGCGVHYIPLHEHPYWNKTFSFNKSMFPESQRIYEQSVSLPIYSKMTDNDITYVVETIKSILSKSK